jgi:hypothetical protein
MSSRRILRFTPILLTLLLAFPFSNGHAQVTSATLSGTVSDDTGAVIPGAAVSTTNANTGATRATETDARGVYHLPLLPVGDYDLRVELQGFQAAVRPGIRLTVGLEATINITLRVGAVTESVEVTGEAPIVETTTSTLAALVDDEQIRDLPLNGRDFTQLVLLQTGANQALSTGGTIRQNTGTGAGKRISVSGARVSANLYLVDGTEVMDVHRQTPGAVTGGGLGIEAIREFSLLTNSYSASHPSQGGAVVNSVSMSGTNEIHGSLFEFHRNRSLDANDFFLNKADKGRPGFTRNQFGGSAGGPIAQDRTFFFGTMELLRQRRGEATIGTVLDDNARMGILPESAGGNVGVHPDIVQFIDTMPRSNGQNFGDGTAQYVSSFSEPIDQMFWMTRVDHRISDSDNIFFRYTFDNSTISGPGNLGATTQEARYRWQYATLEHNHIFSPTWINTARLGFARAFQGVDDTINFSPLPERFELTPGFTFGDSSALRFDGGAHASIGGFSNYPKLYITNNFQILNDVSSSLGAHQLKLGVNIKRYQANLNAPTSQGGDYFFASVEKLLRGESRRFSGAAPGSGAVRSMRQSMYGVHIEDSYQVRPSLTLNFGMRYEMSTVPTENHGLLANVRDTLDPEVTVGPFFKQADQWLNFQPRVGFAWDMRGDGKTAIRGGFGMFRQYLLSNVWFINVVRNPPFFSIGSVTNPPFLGVYRGIDPGVSGVPSLQANDYDLDHPYVMQYNLTIQREIMSGTSLKVAYAGSRGNHLLMMRAANIKSPTVLSDGRKCFNYTGGNPSCPNGPTSRRNPNFANDARQSSWAQSFYNSMQVNLDRRFSQGLQFGIAYTFSKSIDEGYDRWDQVGNNGNGASGGPDPDDHKNERGLSDFDTRNRFIFNFTYEIPTPAFENSVSRVMLQGWQVNGIWKLSDGNPFSALTRARRHENGAARFTSRPDQAGATNNPVLGGPDRYYDPGAFVLQERGFLGNVGKNTITGPGINNFDFVLVKNFSFGEQRNLEFRSEFFNLFNRPTFARPGAFIDLGSAGRVSKTLNVSRQIQFGLKLNF